LPTSGSPEISSERGGRWPIAVSASVKELCQPSGSTKMSASDSCGQKRPTEVKTVTFCVTSAE
jgi:hypothetical protein